jgi:hypothetical protein
MSDIDEGKGDSTRDPADVVALRLAIEGWRFSLSFLGLVEALDLREQNRHMSSWRYYRKQLNDAVENLGFQLVDLQGHPFDVGLPVKALNLAEFQADEQLVIDRMLEPVILKDGQVARAGTVMVRRRAA